MTGSVRPGLKNNITKSLFKLPAAKKKVVAFLSEHSRMRQDEQQTRSTNSMTVKLLRVSSHMLA